MTILLLVAALLTASPHVAAAQDAPVSASAPVIEPLVIEAAEVSGLDRDRLSAGLRRDIDALAGQPFDLDRVTSIAARIESEHPEVVAAVRDVKRADGRLHVVFLVARISDDEKLESNINARYVVEEVDVTGIARDRVSPEIWSEAQSLIGSPLDPARAHDIATRLETMHPDYRVSRRMSRGSQPGRLHVAFVLSRRESARWLHFPINQSKLVYHQDQGWSGILEFPGPIGEERNGQFSLGLVFSNADDLVDEYGGYWLRFALREAGSARLGLSFDVSRYRSKWRDETLEALAASPAPPFAYRTRLTVEPSVTFAATKKLSVRAGVHATELSAEDASVPSERASGLHLTVAYDPRWIRPAHAWGTYTFSRSVAALGSDVDYSRHFATAAYVFGFGPGRGALLTRATLGRIEGNAPLFERFTAGDSVTLRGWDKYAIAPLGGTRLAHASFEYHYDAFLYFFDTGSVWTSAADRKGRMSTGIGVQARAFTMVVGVPLNADHISGTFMFRLSGLPWSPRR